MPIGDRTSRPAKVFKVGNEPTVIQSQRYCGHALDEMRTQGIMPSLVENTLRSGQRFNGYPPTREVFYDAANNLSVVVEKSTREIVTVSFGKLKGVG
jgi:hypothetical protein